MSQEPGWVPESFGEFRLSHLLGRGGMGQVYRAEHPRYGEVALKVLHPNLQQRPGLLERFWREQDLSRKVQDPSLVPVIAAGEAEEGFFLAMPFYPGGTLFEKQRSLGKIPPAQALSWSLRLLQGLERAHAQGIIHRDLKPENILFDAKGDPALSDFGIAKFLESTGWTRSGASVGTPYYMAPEQVKNAKRVTPQADVYSFGILLYEMVTGSVPYYSKDPLRVAHQHVRGTPVRPRALVPELDPELEKVILKAMEKSPEDRFGSASEMARALERVRDGKPTGIQIKGATRELPPPSQSWENLALAGVIAALVVWIAKALLAPDPLVLDEAARPPPSSGQRSAREGARPAPERDPLAELPAPESADARVEPEGPLPEELLRLHRWSELEVLLAQRRAPRPELGADWLEELRDLLSRGDVSAADRGLKAFRQSFPDQVWGPFLEAEIALMRGQIGAAGTAFAEGFLLAPKEEVELLFDRYRPSLQDLGKAGRARLSERLFEAANDVLVHGDFSEALVLLRLADRLQPRAQIHLEMARIYQKMGNRSRVLWHQKRAKKLASGKSPRSSRN